MANYEPGTRWISGEVTQKLVSGDKVELHFIDSHGVTSTRTTTVTACAASTDSSLPPLRNPPQLEGVVDLVNLSHLNEPSVLHSLRSRYADHLIYTFSGIVLIAMNPFAPISGAYGPEIIQAYAGRRKGELEPHLYAIAQEAYSAMQTHAKNQTIIVSGESGAGKTVSASHLMRFLASAKGHTFKRAKEMTEVEAQILATNPILEAFGNAKTTRNANSSRFGRYMQILFSHTHDIVGARIRVYLLERSRVVFQAQTERNYHIFYQLCAGAPPAERKELGLAEARKFAYLNQGGQPAIPGVDDAADFAETCKGLSTIGIPHEKQWSIFRILAALLHIGNIQVSAQGNTSNIPPTEPNLVLAANLLGISPDAFAKWSTKKLVVTRTDKIESNLSQSQAIAVRDSVAKFIYVNLFEWLVMVLNDSLDKGLPHQQWLSILDIYGFEHFKSNSYEQLLINTTNERLQHEFNKHVFKLEQDDYVAEGIDWTYVSYSDNQLTIDVIENKLGVLALLDEESRLPAGADASFLSKLDKQLIKPEYKDVYKKPRFASPAFIIAHYALDVQYDVAGFVDKNRDSVPDEHIALLHSTTNTFLKEVLDRTSPENDPNLKNLKEIQAAPGRKTIARKPTLGSIFKLSLQELMNTIDETNAHYIRCIKPNDNKKAWEFEPQLALAQLRACGVLETIKISAAGYPSRWLFTDFVNRYYVLTHSENRSDDLRKTSEAILIDLKGQDRYQFGKTTIFFRAGEIAKLESAREAKLHAVVVLIQKNFQRGLVLRQQERLRNATIKIQAWWRGRMAVAYVKELRRTIAVTNLQTWIRAHRERTKFLQQNASVKALQAICRGGYVRQQMFADRRLKAITELQQLFRGCLVRSHCKTELRKIALVQGCWKRKVARAELKKLKAEARSVGHFQEQSLRLEQKIVGLTQSLQQRNSEKKELASKLTGLQRAYDQLQGRHKEQTKQVQTMQSELEKSTVPQSEFDKVQEQAAKLKRQLDDSSRIINLRDAEITKLAELSTSRATELKQIDGEHKKQLALAGEQESTIAELRQEVASLREALIKSTTLNAQAKTASKQESNQQNNSFQLGRSYEPFGLGTSTSTPPRPNGHKYSQNGALGVESDEKENMDDDSKYLGRSRAQDDMSLTKKPVRLGSDAQTTLSASEELRELLSDGEILDQEFAMLLKNIRIVPPSATRTQSEDEYLCIAHLIITMCQEQFEGDLTAQVEMELSSALVTIQDLVVESQDGIVYSTFWLANVHRMLSMIIAWETMLEENGTILSDAATSLLVVVKHDFSSLEFNIYHHFLQHVRKRFERMIGPALIEFQALPGFVETNHAGGRFFSWGARTPAYTMDDILGLFDEVLQTMKTFRIHPDTIRTTMIDLLQLVGAHAFNDLILRTKFGTWKRAIQIQYNITRLEEWCKLNSIIEGPLQLESLQQATKLLQLKKEDEKDLEVLFDVCWHLSPAQIQKLVRSVAAYESEQQVPQAVYDIIAKRVPPGSEEVTIAIDETSLMYETPEPDDVIWNPALHIPSYINLPHISRISHHFM